MNLKRLVIIIFLIGVVSAMIYFSQSLRRTYESEVSQGLKAGSGKISGLLTEQDIAGLPEPVQKYLRYVGAIGKPKVWNFRASFTGRMKPDPQKDWMNVSGEQYNFFSSPRRMFWIKGKMFGVPFYGLHAYKEEKGTMRIKVAGIIPVVNAKGPEMNTSDTTTLFNDMCIFAPATLIDKRISWETVDKLSAKATFTNGANKITAVLYFNEQGQLINFVSDDRYMTASGNTYRKLKWSTPVTDYRNFNGFRLASRGEAVWNMPEGDYKYMEITVNTVDYNLPEITH